MGPSPLDIVLIAPVEGGGCSFSIFSRRNKMKYASQIERAIILSKGQRNLQGW